MHSLVYGSSWGGWGAHPLQRRQRRGQQCRRRAASEDALSSNGSYYDRVKVMNGTVRAWGQTVEPVRLKGVCAHYSGLARATEGSHDFWQHVSCRRCASAVVNCTVLKGGCGCCDRKAAASYWHDRVVHLPSTTSAWPPLCTLCP